MLESLHTNPTQVTGLLAFACAAAACAYAALARQQRLWWLLAAAASCFTLEVAVGLRHRAHALADGFLQAQGWYTSRGPVQVALLVVAALLALGTLLWLMRLRRADVPTRIAATASAVAFWLFLVETISLHAVDSVMYLHIGPVLLIGWAWAAAALVIVRAAWLASQNGTVLSKRSGAPVTG